jgi:hypothetical protein
MIALLLYYICSKAEKGTGGRFFYTPDYHLQAVVNPQMDEYIKPDTVILSFSERFIAERLPIAKVDTKI